MKSISRPGVIRALPFLLFVATPFAASGQTVFFTGTSNAPWSVGGNWGTGSKPTSSQIAGINGNSGGAGSGGVILVDQNEDVGGVAFSGSVAKTLSIGTGVELTLHGTVVSSTTTLLSNAGNQNLSVSGSGSLVLANSGAVNVTNGNRTLSITAKITETGGSRQIVKTGSGTLQLTNAQVAASTYSGGMRIAGGSVTTNVSTSGAANAPTQGAFGTGTITFEAGTTLNYSGNTAGTIHNRVSLEGDASFGTGTQTQTLTLAGDVDLNGGSRTVSVLQSLVASGTISNGSLIKSGSSQLQLTGVNSYTGATHVQEGTLSLGGSGSIAASSRIEVDAGATLHVGNGYALAADQQLTGEGTVTGTLRTGGGIIDPGADGVGQLEVKGNALFDGGAIRFELADSGYDQLVFSGDGFTLAGNTTGAVRLALADFDETALPGQYLLISASGLTNATFTDWSVNAFTLDPLPATWHGALRMENNNLYFDLHAVPEPRAYLLLSGAAMAAWALRGRRR